MPAAAKRSTRSTRKASRPTTSKERPTYTVNDFYTDIGGLNNSTPDQGGKVAHMRSAIAGFDLRELGTLCERLDINVVQKYPRKAYLQELLLEYITNKTTPVALIDACDPSPSLTPHVPKSPDAEDAGAPAENPDGDAFVDQCVDEYGTMLQQPNGADDSSPVFGSGAPAENAPSKVSAAEIESTILNVLSGYFHNTDVENCMEQYDKVSLEPGEDLGPTVALKAAGLIHGAARMCANAQHLMMGLAARGQLDDLNKFSNDNTQSEKDEVKKLDDRLAESKADQSEATAIENEHEAFEALDKQIANEVESFQQLDELHRKFLVVPDKKSAVGPATDLGKLAGVSFTSSKTGTTVTLAFQRELTDEERIALWKICQGVLAVDGHPSAYKLTFKGTDVESARVSVNTLLGEMELAPVSGRTRMPMFKPGVGHIGHAARFLPRDKFVLVKFTRQDGTIFFKLRVRSQSGFVIPDNKKTYMCRSWADLAKLVSANPDTLLFEAPTGEYHRFGDEKRLELIKNKCEPVSGAAEPVSGVAEPVSGSGAHPMDLD